MKNERPAIGERMRAGCSDVRPRHVLVYRIIDGAPRGLIVRTGRGKVVVDEHLTFVGVHPCLSLL